MINWRSIRVHNQSQNNAFEELVCQFARHNPPPNNKQFYRLGTPDGGVECYWSLNNGKEVGWQAKYVFNVEDLISQIDKSIKTAIKNHPDIDKYIVAAPFNLPDPQYTNKAGRPIKSAKTKWEEKVAYWKEELSTEGNTVEIELWDESYLNDLLIKPINEGLRYYWFNGSEFTIDRFKDNLEATIADLGPRYTPELNVELNVSFFFDCLLRNDRTLKMIQKYHFDLKSCVKNVVELFEHTQRITDLALERSEFFKILAEIYGILKVPGYSETQEIKFPELLVHLKAFEKNISSIWDKLNNSEKLKFKNSSHEQTLNQIFELIYEGKDLFYQQGELINNPFMILHGEPGIGKSHLLADICLKQVQRGIPSLLFLGDQFSKSFDPRESIKQRLQYAGSFNSLLQLLDSIGQIHNQRILIAIDALNEGEGTDIWFKYLAGLETDIKRYRWIALVVSVRKDYIEDIVPEKCRERMNLIEHQGFDEAYDFACEHFFEHFGLDIRVPIFNNEFNNPLFLKLFCESCQNIRFTGELPSLPKIFEEYMNYINEKLYRKFKYEKSLGLIKVAVNQLAEELVLSENFSIPYNELQAKFVTTINISLGNISPPEYFGFVDALIKEGIFRTFTQYSSKQKRIGFAYDKMKDYSTLLYRLNQKPLEVDINMYIKSSSYFVKLLEGNTYGNNTMLELLAIMLPEKYKTELFECTPNGKITKVILTAFFKSLQWRTTIYNAKKIGEWLVNISNNDVELKKNIIDNLLPIAAVSKHPFNIEFISSNFLSNLSMSELDTWWTPHINNKYESYENNIYIRIVKWCWRIDRKQPIDADTRFLFGLTLSWLCSSSNRALRDSATKGLTCIYLNHVDQFKTLFSALEDVNDIYIKERIYAAAYGAIVHTKENDKVKAISDYIVDAFFNATQIYPNILIRDYARGIVEYSIYCGNYNEKELAYIKAKIRPPYGSRLPKIFPSNEDIQTLKEAYTGTFGLSSIINSMKTGQNYGDFGRYTFASTLENFIDVDINKFEKWCVARIIELGYNPNLHDKVSPRYDNRGNTRVERIGKKYQWIVFHEILALIADNYELKGDNWWEDKASMSYNGPWYPNIRDIDPTLLIAETKGLKYNQPPKSWFSNFNYLPIDNDGIDWIKEELEIGNSLISMIDPEGVEWITLCYYPFWNEYPADFNVNDKSEKKSMRAYIFSYITDYKTPHEFDVSKINEWNWTNIYASEYYWSPAYKKSKKDYGDTPNWEKVKLSNGKTIDIMQTTQRYIWEKETDFSKSDVLAFDIPTEFLFKSMGLKSYSKPGYYYLDDKLVCINPSIDYEANHQLLIRKDVLYNWLEEKKLKIYWRIKIEKYLSEAHTNNTKKWSDYEGWYSLENQRTMGKTKRISGSDY